MLTGQAEFLADVDVPGGLQLCFVRSPHASARIRGIDVAAACAAPGVVTVLTEEDLDPVLGDLVAVAADGLHAPSHPALARDEVRFVGDPVAAVIAISRDAAVDAAELVDIRYEVRPAVVGIDNALRPGSSFVWSELGTNVMHHQEHSVGDVDGALAGAALVVRERFEQRRHAHVPMECRGTIARVDPSTGRLDVVTGHQSPHDLRIRLAHALGLDADQVRVRCPDMGGSFGQKSGLSREDVVVAAAARQLRRPVVWVEERSENLASAGHARGEQIDVEAGFDTDGHVLGVRLHLMIDLGAYPQIGYPANGYANLVRSLFPAAYRLRHYGFTADLVATNTATHLPYRGPWQVETFVRERLLDVAARRLGLDRFEIRRRNLLSPEELTAGSCVGVDLRSVTQRETLEAAADLLIAEGWHEQVAEARAAGRRVGLGLATYVEPAPVSPSLLRAMGVAAVARSPQEARLRLERDGAVTLFTSQQPHGQGHATTLAQLAADGLGVPMESVRVVWGDTDLVPVNRVGTGGSRAATLASGAVLAASAGLRSRLLDLAAERLEIDPGDLDIVDGWVVPRDAPSLGRSLGSLVEEPIEETGHFLSDDGTWSQATHCCLVEVDAETGGVRVLRYLVVEDCGPPINPAIVDGQVTGGVVQGIGAVLLEHAAYAPDGQLLAGTLVDYLVPSAAEVPAIDVRHLHHELADLRRREEVPFRGVGEGGAIGAPAAVVSAIEDALVDLGLELHEQHLPPAVLWELLRARPTRATHPRPGRPKLGEKSPLSDEISP